MRPSTDAGVDLGLRNGGAAAEHLDQRADLGQREVEGPESAVEVEAAAAVTREPAGQPVGPVDAVERATRFESIARERPRSSPGGGSGLTLLRGGSACETRGFAPGLFDDGVRLAAGAKPAARRLAAQFRLGTREPGGDRVARLDDPRER